MAPDLNSVPPSPRPLNSSPHLPTTSRSRRTSQQTVPLPSSTSPQSTINILPSNQNAVNQSTGTMMSASGGTGMSASGGTGIGGIGDNTGVGTGPGPLRHPRPLTAADLHLQLEKEQ